MVVVPSEPKKIGVLIKKKAFHEKMGDIQKDGFFYEYRAVTNYWRVRLRGIEYPATIVLNIGKGSHRYTAVECMVVTGLDVPEKYWKFMPGLRPDDAIYRIKVIPFQSTGPVSIHSSSPQALITDPSKWGECV